MKLADYKFPAEVEIIISQRDELLAIAQRWAVIDAGSWHQSRYNYDRTELLKDTRAAIDRVDAEKTLTNG